MKKCGNCDSVVKTVWGKGYRFEENIPQNNTQIKGNDVVGVDKFDVSFYGSLLCGRRMVRLLF